MTMYLILGISTLFYCFLFGLLYRMHGGAPPKLPWKLDEILIGVLIGLPIFLISLKDVQPPWEPYPYIVWVLTGISALWAAVLKVKGHGQYMNLKFLPPWNKRITPETWDVFLIPLFGKDPRTSKDWKESPNKELQLKHYGLNKLYWRCLSGLFISGSSVVLGAVGCLIYLGFWIPALVLFFGAGLSKSISYALGWKIHTTGNSDPSYPKELDEATEIGELGSGIGLSLFLIPTLYTAIQVLHTLDLTF